MGLLQSMANVKSNRRRFFEALLLGVFVLYLIFFHALANMQLEGRPDLVEVCCRVVPCRRNIGVILPHRSFSAFG